ncbi:unnamed protein product [Withania somnifera]
MSGIGCVIALITAAAMGSAFLISRKHKTNNITKKERMEEESSNKGLQFILPGSSSSSPCIQQLQPSSVGTDKLCLNDNDSTSLFSTPCSIQDDKPKLGMSDEKRDTLNAIVSDHPKEVGKSPSFDRLPIYEEELVLSETKISLPLDADQELNEVSRARVEVIQENEKTEVLEHVNQAQHTISYNPALQLDNKREILVHNDKGESNELHHTGVIEMDNLEEGLIQEQEKQAAGYQEAINPDGSLQETSTLTEHEPLNTAFDLMKAADEDEDKDHMQSMHFEEQCADAKTQIDQFSKKCDIQMQFNDEEECAKENDQTNSRYEEATSENCPCRTYSIVVPASGIINVSIDDKHPAEAYEDEDKGHMQIMYFEEHCADAETKIDRISKKCNKKKQFSDKQVCSNENDQENSCYEEAMSENSHCRTYSVDMQILAASEIRNASVDDQNSSEVTQVIKETNVMDPAASGEQSAETDCSPIQLVEKQSFEQDCQENVLEEDNEASKSLSMDIEVVIKDLEAHSKEEKDEVEESVFVYGEEDDDYDNDIEKDAAAPETLDNISEVARNFSEQSNSDKVCAADSNKDLLLELKKEKKVNEEEEGMKIEENETCSVENCSLKSTQNDFARTSYKQSSNGKDDPTVNVIDSYRRKLISLDDIAAIPWGRKLLLGVLLVLIWYFVLKGILPSGIGIFRF